MKTAQRITSVFLAAVFLFSSLGFTISSMVCLKSGKEKISLAKMEDCCVKIAEPVAPEKDACCEEKESSLPEKIISIEKGNCCDINSYTFNLNDFQNSQKVSLEQPIAISSFFFIPDLFTSERIENKLVYNSTDLPPPLYGRTLLNFISILTI